MQLPSVSVIQAGGLPLENAQIVIEAVSAGKKEVNRGGLVFIEGQEAAASGAARAPVERSLDQLASRLGGAPALRVSCFVSALNGLAGVAPLITTRFPSAAVNVVQ